MAEPTTDRLRRIAQDFDKVTRFRSIAASASQTLNLTTPKTFVLGDTSGGNVTLTLPDPKGVPGHLCAVKKVATANTLTITGSGAELPVALTTRYAALNFTSINGSWYVW